MNRNVVEIKTILADALIGQSVVVNHPEGHGIGGPLERIALDCLNAGWKGKTGRRVYKPHVMWNALIRSRPDRLGEDRLSVFDPIQQHLAITRRTQIINSKTDGVSVLVEPNQGATADFLTTDVDQPYRKKLVIGDVKATKDSSNSNNNLVSYAKIARMCELMLKHSKFDTIDFIYVGIHYRLINDRAWITNVYVVDLFLEPPWTLRLSPAQRQIQSTISKWSQTYSEPRSQWCRDFLTHKSNKERLWRERGVV